MIQLMHSCHIVSVNCEQPKLILISIAKSHRAGAQPQTRFAIQSVLVEKAELHQPEHDLQKQPGFSKERLV